MPLQMNVILFYNTKQIRDLLHCKHGIMHSWVIYCLNFIETLPLAFLETYTLHYFFKCIKIIYELYLQKRIQ